MNSHQTHSTNEEQHDAGRTPDGTKMTGWTLVSSRIIEEKFLEDVPADVETRNVTEEIKEIKTVIPLAGDPVKTRGSATAGNSKLEGSAIKEYTRRIPVTKHVIAVPRETIKIIPKREVRVRQAVEPVTYTDVQRPVVVAQTLVPTIRESRSERVKVEVQRLIPELIPVDIFIPKPVSRPLLATHRHDRHVPVSIPSACYNQMVRNMNPSLNAEQMEELLCEANRFSENEFAVPCGTPAKYGVGE